MATVWLLCGGSWIRLMQMTMTEMSDVAPWCRDEASGGYAVAPANARAKRQAYMTQCMVDTCARAQRLTRWKHAHDEIPSHCERKKRSFAHMSSFNILPPSPPRSMLGAVAHHDLHEKERFSRIGSTAEMSQH